MVCISHPNKLPNLFPMLAVTRESHTTELSIFKDNQMFSSAITSQFCTGLRTGLLLPLYSILLTKNSGDCY